MRGTSVPRVGGEPEVSASVVRGEALREPGAQVADVLSRSPGVQVNRTGSSADLSTASIRGDEGSQVPVYLAGIRLNDDIVGVADLSRVPLFMIERIEIYRGTAPLRVARGGMNGALLFEPVLPTTNSARVGASAGSFGSAALWAGAAGATSWGEDQDGRKARFSTSLSYRRAGAENDYMYPDDAGTAFVTADDERVARINADHSESDLWMLSRGSIPLEGGQATTTLVFNHFEREKGVSGLALLPAQSARASLGQELVGVSTRLPCSLGLTGCQWSLSSSLLTSRLTTTDPDAELSLGATAVAQHNQRVTNEAQLLLRPTNVLSGHLGASFETSRISIDSLAMPLARGQEAYFGASGSVGVAPRPGMLFRGVGRASCLDASGTDAGAASTGGRRLTWSECHPEGRVGASVLLSPPLRVRAIVARGIRYPTLGERFGVSAVTRGNSALGIEKAWSFDVGATYEHPLRKWGSFWIDASAFSRLATDLVAFRRSSLGYVRPYNVARSRFFGGELSAELDVWGNFRSRSSLGLLDPRDVTQERIVENDLIPFRSRLTVSQEVEIYTRDVSDVVDHLGLITYLTYRSGRVADPAGLIVIPQQVVVDVAARARVHDKLDLKLRGENLFQSARFDALGFPLPGRAVFVSAEVQLQ